MELLTVSYEGIVKESITLMKDCKENPFLGVFERGY
jgi:hypothetical protein